MAIRNNIHSKMSIPQYANLTMCAEGCNLSVTFPIKDSTVEYVTIPQTMFNIYCFRKNNRGHITAKLSIPYTKLATTKVSLQDCVYHYSRIMCNQLKIILRQAKIKELKDEVIQLSLF